MENAFSSIHPFCYALVNTFYECYKPLVKFRMPLKVSKMMHIFIYMRKNLNLLFLKTTKPKTIIVYNVIFLYRFVITYLYTMPLFTEEVLWKKMLYLYKIVRSNRCNSYFLNKPTNLYYFFTEFY